MRNLLRPAYKFSELSDSVKDKIRDEWRIMEAQDGFWMEYPRDDARDIGAMFGLTFEGEFYFSLDHDRGAALDAYYSYSKGGARKVKEYAPQDNELAQIVDGLQRVQKRNFYQITARLSGSTRGFYTSIEVDRYDGVTLSETDSDEVFWLLQDYLSWVLKNLEAEYEYRTSDKAIDEGIEANTTGWWSADGHRVEGKRAKVRARVPRPMIRRMRQTVFPWAGSTLTQICRAAEGVL